MNAGEIKIPIGKKGMAEIIEIFAIICVDSDGGEDVFSYHLLESDAKIREHQLKLQLRGLGHARIRPEYAIQFNDGTLFLIDKQSSVSVTELTPKERKKGEQEIRENARKKLTDYEQRLLKEE
jgi:hypothetical protein